jgi:tRNA (guanine10-N2)-dimethyltransferase
MTYLFSLSKDHLELAKAEITALFGESSALSSSLLILHQPTLSLTQASRLGLTRTISNILLCATTLEELLELTLSNTFKITVHAYSPNALSSQALAELLYARQTQPRVNLHNPSHHYVFYWFADVIFATEEIYVNQDTPHSRRSHLKQYNHPTSIHPKLARAMINLSGQDTFIDPFCGAGGIVIEGLLMGLSASGSDINQFLITKAKENAKQLALTTPFTCKDALTLSQKTPAIVTDLPYGKNSMLSESLTSLYEKFFLLAQTLTPTLVIGVAASLPLTTLLASTSWQQQHEFSLYVHKSLTRKICVLTQR